MIRLSSTPQQILGLLKKYHKLSINDLKHHLQITDMAVRKHIARLEKEGFIRSYQVKQPVGRPITYYQLSNTGENLFPKKYSLMTIEFLQDIEEMYGIEAIHALFENRENRLQQKYETTISKNENLQEKVKELEKIQNEHGYMAEARQLNEQEFELTEYNCPIYHVAQRYKKACQCELSLFKRVLGVQQIERVSCISEGDHCCKYSIKAD